jgi:YYY domain-containing protein
MPVLTFCCWLALVWGSGWLFWPLARRIFGDTLPDGGLAVGRVLFLAFWTLSAFWIGHSGVSTRVTSLLWIVLGAMGLVVGLRDKAALQPELRTRKRAIIAGDVIFLCVFLGFFALRSFWSETDGNNGEKSMDSALIGSLARAQKLPPPNPYAAGSDLLGYYYFGHLQTALLTNATGTTNRWSYNLMCATIPALCFSTLFSLGAGLTRRLWGGVFVAVAVLGLGTLQPIIQWRHLAEAIPAAISSRSMEPFSTWTQNSGFGSSTPFNLDFFATSRVIPYTINEYPWFTFNQADLHAHYLDFTFALATMCLAFAIYSGRRAALVPAALVLGAQVMTNTWDYPAYAIVLGLGTLSATGLARCKVETNVPDEAESHKPALAKRLPLALAVVLGALLVAVPYLLNLKTSANPPRLLHQPITPLREWLVLWGPFFVGWLAFLSYTLFRTTLPRALCLLGCAAILWTASHSSWFMEPSNSYQPSPLVLMLVLLSLGLALIGSWKLRDQPRFLCFLAVGGLVALLWSETTWAGFLGDVLNPGPEDYKRQDTVFKFGVQTWMLWGVAVASGAFITLRRWPEALKCAYIVALPVLVLSSISVAFGRTHNFLMWDSQGAWVGWGKGAPGDPYYAWNGWDAWAHLAPPERAAAAWLQEHTPPGQNIIEAEQADGGDYSIYTRYTHATGIPTVIGPQAHSFQWGPADLKKARLELGRALTHEEKLGREWDEVFRRKAAVRAFFTATDPSVQRDILTRYGVRYIVCGELERKEYGEEVLELLRTNYREEAHFGTALDPHEVWIFAAPGT